MYSCMHACVLWELWHKFHTCSAFPLHFSHEGVAACISSFNIPVRVGTAVAQFGASFTMALLRIEIQEINVECTFATCSFHCWKQRENRQSDSSQAEFTVINVFELQCKQVPLASHCLSLTLFLKINLRCICSL